MLTIPAQSIPPFPNGVITAAVTPMHGTLQTDTEKLAAHCQSLLANGSDGIVLLGTTGEANSFSAEERMDILDHLLVRGISPHLLMVGTGCCAISDTIRLTQHAVHNGVRHILMLPPFYYKPVPDDGLLQYFSQVIDRVNTDFCLYLYHFPQLTGIDLSIELIARLIGRFPDVVTGIKDSSGDWSHISALRTALPGCQMYCGSEAFLLDTIRTGGAGCISATANVTVRVAAAVVNAYRSGTDPNTLQDHLTALRGVFDGQGFVGALKGYLALTTGDADWLHIRPPNMIPDAQILNAIHDRYTQLSGAQR